MTDQPQTTGLLGKQPPLFLSGLICGFFLCEMAVLLGLWLDRLAPRIPFLDY